MTQLIEAMRAGAKAVIQAPEAALTIPCANGEAALRLGGNDTGNVFSIAESLIRPGGNFSAPVHLSQDELIYVLEGDFTMRLGDRSYNLSAGTTVYLPRDAYYTGENTGETSGRLLTIVISQDAIVSGLCEPRVVAPDAGWTIENPSGSSCCKLTGEEAGGAFAFFVQTIVSGGGPPPHIHTREEETFYILEGEFSVFVDGQTYRAAPGSIAYLPRGIRHTFKNVGQTTGRFLMFATPPGMEYFLSEYGKVMAETRGALAKAGAVADSFGIRMVS